MYVSTRKRRVLIIRKEVRELELTPRKMAILEAIVKYHIATGEPVGSKWLTGVLENAPSSATLRNEMSDLCSLGFLAQPHTSAGRIPTSKGYEFYVSRLMSEDALPEQLKETIDEQLKMASQDTETLTRAAAEILSNITGLPAFYAKLNDDSVALKRVEVMPMGAHLLMLVAFTSDGRTGNKLLKTAKYFDGDAVKRFSSLIKTGVEGKTLNELTVGNLQNIFLRSGADALDFLPLVSAFAQMINDIGKSDINLCGEHNLYLADASPAEFISFMDKKEGILSIIERPLSQATVIFGSDTGYRALISRCLAVAPFGTKDFPLGRIGVIGSTRMSYDRILPSVAYLALRLSELMNENFD